MSSSRSDSQPPPSGRPNTLLPSVRPLLFICDFDHSLFNFNSDEWIFQVLSPTTLYPRIAELHGKMQWQELLSFLFREGRHKFPDVFTPAGITAALRSETLKPDMVKAVTVARHAGGFNTQNKLVILSDANTIFINEILKASKADSLFDTVITNPAHFDDTGCLCIDRYRPASMPPHGCVYPCAVNMCKGQALDAYLKSLWPGGPTPTSTPTATTTTNATKATTSTAAGGDYAHVRLRMIYLGDSTNDFCPATRLTGEDVLLARKGRSLLATIGNRPGVIKARVVEWETATDVLEFFVKEYEGVNVQKESNQ